MPPSSDDELHPSDPPFLFVTLLAARKAGDQMLESLARDWLRTAGISVVFTEPLAPRFEMKRGTA